MNGMLLEGGLKLSRTIRKQMMEAFSRADGTFISGQALANVIGCSRTAIWKHIEELRKSGVEIEAVRKKGYRLIKMPDVLFESEILLGLETKKIGHKVVHFDSVESTQPIAHQLAVEGTPDGTVIIAEEQTGGRGRMARSWYSPKQKGIWMSLIVRPLLPLEKAPQFTLIAAIALVRAIEEVTNLDVRIKWPNDILHMGRKVTGILTEVQGEADQINYLVIGIGVNVNQTRTDFPDQLRDTATSLFIEKGELISRKKLVQSILKFFEKYYTIYLEKGFVPLKIIWESYADRIGEIVTARTINGDIVGTALGITDEGVLIIQDHTGIKHHIYSADIEFNRSNKNESLL